MLLMDDVLDYDPPEWINATDSIDSLILAIRNTLQVWLDFHTNPIAWAAEWAMNDDWQILLENPPSNRYFSVDIKTACIETLAETYIKDNLMIRCKNCNMLLDAAWDCDCDNPDYDTLTDDDKEELIEWLSDIDCIIDDETIQKTMINQGFKEYWKALESVIAGVVEEVQTALQQYDEIETNTERLSWALNASAILHINGDICKDYGDRVGLDYETVCKYRDNGLTALFSKEEIREYIEQDDYNE